MATYDKIRSIPSTASYWATNTAKGLIYGPEDVDAESSSDRWLIRGAVVALSTLLLIGAIATWGLGVLFIYLWLALAYIVIGIALKIWAFIQVVKI